MCDYCSWIDQILTRIKIETAESQKQKPRLNVDPVIIVHGGAGKLPLKIRQYMLLEVKNAAVEAYKDLINGRTAVDGVEKAVSHMETKQYFNCAKGGSLDVNDEIVTDAGIVTKNDAGFVGGIRDIEHPISLARKVLKKTEHILLVENGAQKFALANGIDILPPGSLNVIESVTSHLSGEKSLFESVTSYYDETECGEQEWRENVEDGTRKECRVDCVVERSEEEEAFPYCVTYDLDLDDFTIFQAGAVGAVAYDRRRRLASGTSTSGEPGKPVGTVSSIGTVIGCGIFADEEGCASVSGNDINMYRYAPARKIVKNLLPGVPLKCAVSSELESFEAETGDSDIGVILLNAKGEPFISFKCTHFPWAFCRNGYVYYGSEPGEKYWEKVNILERPLDCMCNISDEE